MPVELPSIRLSIRLSIGVPARGADPTLPRIATLYLEQTWGAPGPGGGANQIWLDVPPALSTGLFRSEGPTQPALAQLAGAPDGADARNWQTGEATWALEITRWDVKIPDAAPDARADCGLASGRVAVSLRDGFGGPETGQVAGTFADVPVRCEPRW